MGSFISDECESVINVGFGGAGRATGDDNGTDQRLSNLNATGSKRNSDTIQVV